MSMTGPATSSSTYANQSDQVSKTQVDYQSFLKLQDEIAETENRIAVARTDYNQTAGEYNTYIRKFPAAMTAKVRSRSTRSHPSSLPYRSETTISSTVAEATPDSSPKPRRAYSAKVIPEAGNRGRLPKR